MLSDIGKFAEEGIKNMLKHYPVNVDCYVVMPNHVHILIEIASDSGRSMIAPTLPTPGSQWKKEDSITDSRRKMAATALSNPGGQWKKGNSITEGERAIPFVLSNIIR